MEFREVYRNHADRYHSLVSAEDVDGNLRAALTAIFDGAEGKLLDVGAGTGRVSRILLELGAQVIAVEPESAMLDVARRELAAFVPSRLDLVIGDARELPLEDGSVAGAVAGWVFGHFRYWEEADWRAHIQKAILEMQRVVTPGGATVVIETLGSAQESAATPNERLAEYYAWLEAQGFNRTQIATDYAFPDAAAAASCLGFFFGEAVSAQIHEKNWARVPEWTGIWTRRVSG